MIKKLQGDVLLIATLDTKGEVAGYLKQALEEKGKSVLMLDCSMRGGEVCDSADITPQEVARAGGCEYGKLATLLRGSAAEVMMGGVALVVKDLYGRRRFKGVLGIGGSDGTLLATAGMKELPVGVPKLMISAMACGKQLFGSFVGTKDVTMMPSVADICGLNPISKRIFDNAVGAMVGMLGVPSRRLVETDSLVAMTMLGQTTPAAMMGKALLEKEGYQVVAFHPNGVGGKAMDEFIKQGVFQAVWELTPHEVGDEYVSGIHSAGPERMEAAGAMGIPQVVVPGCMDFFWGTPGPPDMMKSRYVSRQSYPFNPDVLLVKLVPEEIKVVARILAERINHSQGPIALVIPLQGISMFDHPGESLYNPQLEGLFFRQLKQRVSPRIELVELDAHINDPILASTCVSMLLQMLRG